MTKQQIKEIEELYAKMEKGVANPQAVNRCFKFISGQDNHFRGFKGKEMAIVRFVVMGGLREAKAAAKEDDSKVILTDVGVDKTTNFEGVKTYPAKSESMKPEDQSHEEDFDDGLPELTEEELEIPLVFNVEGAKLATLEGDLSRLEDTEENKRARQTLKMQITKLKNKLDG